MKRPFSFSWCCLFFILPLLGEAQYWDLVQPDRQMLFNQGGNDLNWVISIDSVQVTGTDTVHFPYRILTGDELSTGCRNFQSLSWLGEQILERANGDFVYFNRRGDSILVRPAAPLNASWKMMDLPNGARLEADVIQVDDLGANPIPDTLKTVRLQALTNGGIPILSHPAHELRLKWSRTLGWQTTVDFRTFPDSIERLWFEGARNPVVGRPLPTHAEVYDLGVGNEFHYVDSYSSYTSNGSNSYTRYYKRFILDQVISPTMVTYTDSIVEVKYAYDYYSGADTTYDKYVQTTQVVIDTAMPEPLALFAIPHWWMFP